MKTLLRILILGALATAGAWGGIVITFDAPSQTGHPGDILNFLGVISNTGSDTVFLTEDSLNLAGLSLATTDQFLTTVPVSLDGNTSSRDIDLFDVTVSNPLLDPPGEYLGSYGLIGGVDGDASDNLASANFDVTTAAGGATVPEPGSWLLLGTALAGLGLRARKT
jgi:hypothetical protein